MTNFRILVADDHEVVRRGVRALLESQPGWQVVGEAVNGREALERAKLLKPDLVILDISMPDLNGIEATRAILKLVPEAEILVLTMHESEELVRRVLEAGARGYVVKTDVGRRLIEAADAMRRHEAFFTPSGNHGSRWLPQKKRTLRSEAVAPRAHTTRTRSASTPGGRQGQ
jgi:DNA-binding NarL/FixJ family response regulator